MIRNYMTSVKSLIVIPQDLTAMKGHLLKFRLETTTIVKYVLANSVTYYKRHYAYHSGTTISLRNTLVCCITTVCVSRADLSCLHGLAN